MSIFYIERRSLSEDTSLSWDLAHHMYTRQIHGQIVVLTDRPAAFVSSVSKQWYKVMRQVQRERSSTLHASRILELTHENNNMQRMRMVAKVPSSPHEEGVFFATIDQLLEYPPNCQTLYVTISLPDLDFTKITSQMPHHSLVVHF